MSKNKAVNFIHSYKGYMLIVGGVLMVVGFILNYFSPKQSAKINTEWLSGEFPTMSVAGFAVMVVPYLAVYLIQTIASKIGKKTEPPKES